jgi:hypothetical protein
MCECLRVYVRAYEYVSACVCVRKCVRVCMCVSACVCVYKPAVQVELHGVVLLVPQCVYVLE